jgi:hypothetical protein
MESTSLIEERFGEGDKGKYSAKKVAFGKKK